MRSMFATLFVFVFATVAQADPEVTIRTMHEQTVPINQGISLIVQNMSESEDALDVTVEIKLGPGLDFRGLPITYGLDWLCTRNGATVTCRVPRFAALREDLISFSLGATDNDGGHRSVDVKLTAQNAKTQTLALDVITFRFRQVTHAGDFGAGSLRAAIEDINDSPLCGTDVTCFITFTDLVTLIITPATPLPPIRKCNVFLRAPDDPEFPRPTKKVAISGENATWGNGLEIRTPPCGAGVSISGIAVHSWPWNGIAIEGDSEQSGAAHHSISQTYVGTDYTGQVAKPNGARGIVLDSPHAHLFMLHSIVSNNGRSGIALFRGAGAQIGGVKIMNNGASGVFSFQVPFFVGSSIITGNAHAGVAVVKGTAQAGISSNAIHSNGALPIDWGLDDRTPADDETDGVPNTPRVVDAFYDPREHQTVVRGVVRVRARKPNEQYTIHALLASSPRGDLATGQRLQHQAVIIPEGVAEMPFELEIVGDLRGQLIALQMHAASVPPPGTVSSEISEAVVVR